MLKEPLKHKNSRWVWVRDIAIVLAIFAILTAWSTRNMLVADGSLTLPQSLIVSLEGGVEPMLRDDKPNLVYFFAPWCKICEVSIDNLNYLNGEKINVVVVALDYQTEQEVANFISETGVKSSVYLGSEALKQQFNIHGYPSYYIIDESYTVVGKSYGYSTAVGLKLRELFGFT